MRQPIPGAAALFIWAGAGAGVRVDFHREKIDRITWGSKGETLGISFPPFLTSRKGMPRGISGERTLFNLSAHTARNPAKGDIECAATPFLRVENSFGTGRSERSKETPEALLQ